MRLNEQSRGRDHKSSDEGNKKTARSRSGAYAYAPPHWPCGDPASLLPRVPLKLCRGSGTKTALCRLPGIAPRSKESAMVSGAYLRQQAEILIAMSRATFDLGVAERLRAMASELQTRAAAQEDERGFPDNEVANFKLGS
jgi:hypothetical protein